MNTGVMQVLWLHGDLLGSASLLTNAAGGVVSQARYKPFGETRSELSAAFTDRKFTGQREESVLGGLYDYGARFYDPIIGRFLSPDSIVQDPSDPQSFNRFSYVRNSPLNYTDPTGHQACGFGEGCQNGMFGGRMGADLVGYLIGLGYVTGSAAAAANTLSTPLEVAPAATNNTAGETPQIDASPALGYPLGPAQSAGTVESYPAGTDNADLKLTTPMDGGSTVQIAGPLYARKESLKPDLSAAGAHTTFEQNKSTGEITGYQTWKPNTIYPKYPSPWISHKRVDFYGPAHPNQVTKQKIETPHVHTTKTPGGVRPAERWEIPERLH
jgi:RHS repeat-associated protein